MAEYRTRNFATVIYSEDSLTRLAESKLPCFVSPLHCDDINADGEHKKPHYHVLINYDSVKTISQAREDISEFGGVGCEYVKSNRAYARYLCHLDNPEKAQYSVDEVRTFGGLDYISLIQSESDVFQLLDEITCYIMDNDIIYLIPLLRYCRDTRPDWYRTIQTHTYYINQLLKSNAYYLDKTSRGLC